jgi:D-glycero-D-manno-heptose 1,7-bisphosphate phosphatase
VTAETRAAVFLDRDGVINANVFYADTGEIEAPRRAEDFRILPGAIAAIKRLQGAGYCLFVVSNQPNQAKRKATRADHDAIQARLVAELAAAGIRIDEFYYCFHHPDGIEPALSGACACRKPSPFFLFQARDRHGVSLAHSWMIGDRASDVACGGQAGTRTILVVEEAGPNLPAGTQHTARSLAQAVEFILTSEKTPSAGG